MRVFKTEIQSTTRQYPTHDKQCSTIRMCLSNNLPITKQCPTHYRTMSHPLGDCFSQNFNHYNTMSLPLQNKAPPIRRLLNIFIHYKTAPQSSQTNSLPSQNNVPPIRRLFYSEIQSITIQCLTHYKTRLLLKHILMAEHCLSWVGYCLVVD